MGSFVPTPLVERLKEVLNRFFLRPEVAMQYCQIGEWTLALLSDDRMQRRIRFEVIPWIVNLGHALRILSITTKWA